MTKTARDWNDEGMASLRAGSASAAVLAFTQAIDADPDSPALWMNLASAHRLAKDEDSERAALNGALARDQAHLMANVRLAQLEERRGELASAHRRWAGVTQLAAGYPESDGLTQLLAHANQFVTERTQFLSNLLATELKQPLEVLSGPERRRVDTAIGASTGRRRIYNNQCAGLHYPFLPADEFFARDHFDWLPRLEAATATIRAEFEALVARGSAPLEPYVQLPEGTPENNWTALDGKLDWSALFIWKYGQPQPDVLAACPATAALLDELPILRLPNRGPNVFFSVLEPGKRIPPHTGVTNTRAIVHLPLIVPGDCGFRVGGEIRNWREGEAWVFDDTIEHEAWNNSGGLRAILIFDVSNPYLSPAECAAVAAFMDVADRNGFGPAFDD